MQKLNTIGISFVFLGLLHFGIWLTIVLHLFVYIMWDLLFQTQSAYSIIYACKCKLYLLLKKNGFISLLYVANMCQNINSSKFWGAEETQRLINFLVLWNIDQEIGIEPYLSNPWYE